MCMYCERRTDVKCGWDQPYLPYHGNLEDGALSGNIIGDKEWNGVIHDNKTSSPELILTCKGYFQEYFGGTGIGTIYIPIKYCPECGRELGK